MLKTDNEKLSKILEYCNKISEIVANHKNSKEEYIKNFEFQLSTDMCVFQIGELSTHISDEFKQANTEIPWAMIRGMRNIHAHDYEIIDRDVMWLTITNDITDLSKKIKNILK